MKFTDLSSPEFLQNPYPWYETLRRKGKFVLGAPGMLFTGHYDIIDTLLLDRKMGKGYLESIQARYGENGLQQPAFQALSRMFLMMNPPEHTRLRALLMRAFDMRSIEQLRAVSHRVANELVDAFPASTAFDLVPSFMHPLPVKIICNLLDVPPADAVLLGQAVGVLAASLEAARLDEAALARVNDATLALQGYFKGLVSFRRKHPGRDLISLLISVEDHGVRLTEDEIVSNAILLFAAGHETTSNMIGNVLVALHRHPDQLDLLKRSPDLLPRTIVECLRYESSVQLVTRMALEDTEAGGIRLPKGSLIFMFLGAANRDPERFDDPDKLSIKRPQTNNRLIMFGGGIHYCLGARLATMQLQIALQTLLVRVPRLRLLNLDDLRWQPRNTLRGVESLVAAC